MLPTLLQICLKQTIPLLMSKTLSFMITDLDNYYFKETEKRSNPTEGKKQAEKQARKLRQLAVKLIPSINFNLGKIILTDNGLVIPNEPHSDYEEILGSLKYNHDCLIGKIRFAKLNLKHGYIQIQQVLDDIPKLPYTYLKEKYLSYSMEEISTLKEILENVERNEHWSKTNTNLFLMKNEWMNTLLNQEKQPCHIFRVDRKADNPLFNHYYNVPYIKLIGICPQLFADVVMQTQKIPYAGLDSDIFLWCQRVLNFQKCQQNPVYKEYNTFIITYEGIKVAVKIKQTYLAAYHKQENHYVLLQKNVFYVTNPTMQRQLCQAQRIQKNIEECKIERGYQTTNQELQRQLLDVSANKFPYKKRCGYKNLLAPPETTESEKNCDD